MDRRRRAFALMIAMIATAAVFAAAMSLSLLTRASVVESGALSRALEQELAARSAASRAVAGVVGESVSAAGDVEASPSAGPEGPEVDTDELPEMPEFLREFLEGMLDEETPDEGEAEPPVTPTSTRNAQRHLAARGLPAGAVRVETEGGVYEVRLVDASSLMNVNKASAAELEGVARAAGADGLTAERIAAEIIDYRDEDSFVTPRGAEREDYARRGLEIRNGAMLSVEEIGYLPSMTPELRREMAPLLTVLGDGKLHAPSMPEEILRSLPGMSESAARRILDLRESGRLDAESLERSLSGFSRDLSERFRFTPSPLIRARVQRVDEAGPVFEGLAIVSSQAGVQWASFGVR